MLADREMDREAGGGGRFERMRFLDALPAELHGLAIALYAERGPDPNELERRSRPQGVDQCLLALEADRLEGEIDYNPRRARRGARPPATPAKSPDCSNYNRNLNEARRSLDRRRQDASLLASAGGHR